MQIHIKKDLKNEVFLCMPKCVAASPADRGHRYAQAVTDEAMICRP